MIRFLMNTTIIVVGQLAASTAVHGQGMGFALNPYIGYYDFDENSFEHAFTRTDVESDPIYGVRLGLGDPDGIAFDLAYGRTSVNGEVVADDIVLNEDSTIHLFYGAFNWHLPLPIDLFLSGGGGAIRYAPAERDAVTDLMLNYGAGLTVPIGPVRLRADVKDHVDLCEAPDSDDFSDFGACVEDETLHNIELSAGVVFGW